MTATRTALVHVSPIASSDDRARVPVTLSAEPWAQDTAADDRARVLEYLRTTQRQVMDGWRNKYTVRSTCGFRSSAIAEAHLNALVQAGDVERAPAANGEWKWRAKG